MSRPATALVALAALILAAGCTQAAPPTATATPAGASPPATAPPFDPPVTQATPQPAPTTGAPGAAQPLLPDAAAGHTVGDTIRVSGGEFVGDQADLTVEEAVMLPPAGSTDSRFAFLVKITGLDAEVLPYNLREFTLRDDQDFDHQPLPDGGQEPRLEFGDLLPNRSVRGWLTFEIPHATSYVELHYWPTLALEPAVVRARVP